MKLNSIYLGFAFVLTLCCGCTQGRKGKVGETAYEVLSTAGGPLIRDYDFLSLTYQASDNKSNVLSPSEGYDARPVLLFKVRPYFKGDLNEILGYAAEGDSLCIKIPIDSLVKYGQFAENKAATGTFMTYHLKVNKVVSREGRSDSLLNAAIEELKYQEVTKAENTEESKIKAYIADQTRECPLLQSGIYLLQSGVENTQRIVSRFLAVHYTIKSLDGKLYETNIKELAVKEGIFDKRLKYELHKVDLEKEPSSGFEMAVALLKNRQKVKVLVPSLLAYGKNGNQMIAPYTPLIIEVSRVE